MKKLKLIPGGVIQLIEPIRGAIATDRIVVDGCKVGYMYRVKPLNHYDSGWRFFEGTEDAEYMSDNSNSGVYDVNTIANYDRDIIPYLGFPAGCELERDGDTSKFNLISG